MSTTTDEERDALRAAARRFLDHHASSARVRAAMATERGWEPEAWTIMARELGWAAMAIPEAYGGAGAGFEDVALLFEEMGRANACAPLFATFLGAAAIALCGDDAQRATWLPGLAANGETATFAITERGAAWDASEIDATASKVDGGWSLRGAKRFVIDGHTADHVVVAVREEGSKGEERIALFVVRGDARGVQRRALTTMDSTRRLAEVTLDGVRVGADARLALGDWKGVTRVLHRACVALAAEQTGGAARCLSLSVEYAKVRTQFQRLIGSFQAIKHKCADMLVDVECARSASLDAARVIGAGSSDEEIAIAAAMAKAFCSEAFFRCAAETIQVHGGIGFTWDHDAHLFFKRAKASSQLLGSPAWHRDSLARAIGLT